MTLFIYINAYPTGGAELLHQYCSAVRSLGYDAKMLYDNKDQVEPNQTAYAKYDIPYSLKFEDSAKNTFLTYEGYIYKLNNVKNASKAIWWLSADNYYGYRFIKKGGKLQNIIDHPRSYIHYLIDKRNGYWDEVPNFVQSEHARQFLINDLDVDEKRIHSLSDYINTEYLIPFSEKSQNRSDSILFNPKKGMRATQEIMKAVPEYEWIPLQNMTRDEMSSAMRKAKLYIDFGFHPGKDRIPREAASCGCCIITNREGSASNPIDVPISEKYKFNDISEMEQIRSRIIDCMENYDTHIGDFQEYRNRILAEKEVFDEEVKNSIRYMSV